MLRSLALIGVALVVCACGPASVSGTVGGDGIDSSDAIASKDSLFGIDSLHVVIGGDTSDLCSDLSKGLLHKGASMLQLQIIDANGLRPIEYAVKGAVTAEASKLDTACGDVLKKTANGGTITLTKVDGTTIEGSFDLTFDSGDELKGAFSAALCSNTSVDMKSCQ